MPETDSVSWVMAVTSAAAFWASAATLRLRSPTMPESMKKNGTVATDTRASCHESTVMATSVLMTMTTLERTLESVLVTTFWMPPTSLAILDCISPVRVPVKKPKESRCR